jgi:hypothetical protein
MEWSKFEEYSLRVRSMTSKIWFLIAIFIVALLLDFFYVKVMQRYRNLKKESTDEQESLKHIRWELFRRAFAESLPRGLRMGARPSRSLRGFALEWLLIVLIAYAYCASTLLNFDNMSLQQTGEQPESATLPILAEVGLQRYGEIPLWDPYMLTGFPHMGDLLGHFWNPVATLPVLLWGGVNGMKVSIFLTFIVAGLGQWLFGYVVGLRRVFRVWSAVLFMLSGGLALLWRVGWYELLVGAAWFPWCFGLYLYALRKHSWASIFLVSAAIFMVISTGGGYYPFYLAVCLLLMFIVMVLLAVPEERVRMMRTSALVVLFSLGLSAVILLPSAQVYRLSGRDVPQDVAQNFSQPIEYGLANFVIHAPEWFNSSALGTASGWNWFYIGWLPLAALMLAPLAFSRLPRRRWAILVSGILFLVLMMWFANRYTPVKKIYDWVPFLYNLRFPNRLLIVATSPLLILAAQGLEYLYRLSKAWSRDLQLVYSPAGSKRRVFHARILVILAWVILLFSTLSTVYHVNKEFAFIDQRIDPKSFAVLRWLKDYDKSLYYVNIGGGAIYWNWTPAAYSLEMPVINFLYSRHIRAQESQQADYSPFIARAKYQISLIDQTAPANSKLVHEADGIMVWQVPDVLPYAFSVSPKLIQEYSHLETDRVAPVKVRLNGTNQVIARGSPRKEGEVLVVLMSNFPGWKLSIDGRPAQVTSYNGYLGAKMLPGEHVYQFYYQPTPYFVGAGISLLTLLFFAVVFLWGPIQLRLRKVRLAKVSTSAPSPTAD